MTTRVDLDEVRAFRTAKAFDAWLAKHHADTTGLWLRIYKKDSAVPTVSYDQALDVALCHGWIDGLKRTYDDASFIQRFTPRRARSVWSKRNVGHIARLTRAGRMRPAGLAAVNAAKADGRWARAYDSPRDAKVPADFLREVRRDPQAHAFFQSLNRVNQYAIAYRLGSAKKPETRARRMQQFVAMMKEGRKLWE